MHIHVIKVNYKVIFGIGILIILILLGFMLKPCFAKKETDGISLPIIMYHSVLKDTVRSGKYVVTPSQLEADFKYIKEKGYNTITMNDLIKYVEDENASLPEKPIIITFDDGYYNNFTYVLPLLEKYEMRAVISIVGEYTDNYSKTDEANANYSYLRWKDIKQMMETGLVEFQNHTYNLHSNKNGKRGTKKKVSQTQEQYEKYLSEDILKLQKEFEENTNFVPNTFTYPFGAISKESIDIIKNMGFKASLSCEEGINYINKDKERLFLLKRNNRPSRISSEKFFSKLLK